MAEFDQIRGELGRVRTERDFADDELALARERVKRIIRQQAELDRISNPEGDAHEAERRRLIEERERAEGQLRAALDKRARAKATEVNLFGRFSEFTDPTKSIQRLNDNIPILLMPVRLETRFKTISDPGAAPVNQLWVRVFPDDCWIDSFDPLLTKTEVDNAKTYWIGIWKAGGIEDQERAAWRTLASSHGSGRASWIISQYQPVNATSTSTKADAHDVILTIATETPLAAAEEAAANTFWRDVWLAEGDAAEVAAAQAALEGAVGQSRASEIITKYQPVNFSDPLPAGVDRDEINVSVATVVFATVETKQSSWARAPKINILPDRFVFLGYEGETLTATAIGNPVLSPLIVGPDPSAPKEEQIQHDGAGEILVPDEMKWMTDFNRAVEAGMGFRINLNATQAGRGFSRVLVIGLRLNADEQKAKGELETLFRHHSLSRKGLAVVPQGTPTNNTEAVGSGFDRLDDPDETFNDRKGPLFTSKTGWLDKKDGQWIAEYLGLDSKLFENIHNAGSSDQLTERAMNIALWPATFAHWMEAMMSPVFTRNGIEQTRDFFNHYVIGAGAIPAIRIGTQPYGILPATKLSRMNWITQREPRIVGELRQDPTLAFLRRLYPILTAIDADWRNMLDDVSFVGKEGDAHKILLDIIGLNPASVEWSQRYAESLKTLFNRLNLMGFGGFILAIIVALQRAAAHQLIQNLGGNLNVEPKIFEKIFSGKHSQLKGGVVDDKPLSETEEIRAYTDADKNYIQWLIDSAETSFEALYEQTGFKDDKPPTALLFILLRHAVQLGYHDVSIRAREDAGLLTAQEAVAARIDDPFLHIRDNSAVSESRYQPLYAAAPAITGNPTQPVHQFITAQLPTFNFAFYLREQLAALERLKSQSTARLERAFADHVDCCAYRLDSWLLGIVNYQLSLMRNIREQGEAEVRQGIYLGAYAWLEDLKPENKILTAVDLRDPELINDFGGPDRPPLMRDSTNEGYIHAPSLNHAVAAAVLRNGFVSNASPENRKTMAVNLTSERVRTALALLEGIRAGQGLPDLLGYQFERGLHDRHNLAEVDKFILKLRKAFPLRADRLKSTQTGEGVSIESIEARNVIDGLALVEHMKATGKKTYKFGKDSLLPDATDTEAAAINAEAERLLEAHDAVADLALSEGVYQAVLGNYDRVTSTYDAYARGNFPPEPDIIRTPLNGIGITHRVALHLEVGADPTISPVAGVPLTPRAQAEPALNNWLADILPPPDQVACAVTFKKASSGLEQTEPVTLQDLNIQPADLVAIIQEGNEQAMAELDDRILRHAMKTFGPRPDATVKIAYMEAAQFSVFQLIPLVRNVRRLTTKSRALKATDLTLTNEASSKDDSQPFVDIQRLQLVRNAMQTLRGDLATFQAQLEGPLSDLDNRKNEILTNVDDFVDDIVDLLERAARFAVAQAGWGFAYDFKRRLFTAILKQAFDPDSPAPGQVKQDLVTRWDAKLAEFNARLNDESALPLTATDEERFALLTQAERAISTVATAPLPATPVAFRNDLVNVKLPAFIAKRDFFEDLRDTTLTNVSDLLAQVKLELPVSDFDFVEYSVAVHENEMIVFTQDAVAVAKTVIAELDRRMSAADDLFAQHGTSADAAAQVRLLEQTAKTLLGADFVIFPEFSLSSKQGDEIENALNASRSKDIFQYLKTPTDPTLPPDDFPVDTWLYGVARVRDKMYAWEQTVMFTGSLGRPEPELDAMQLPFIPGDLWLGLEFPPTQKLDRERLLYTAHFAALFNKATRLCGLLLDEWTEIIPTSSVDTGITFHHDRPNCEAPQAMLLVTPSEFRGAWQWQDLVDALNETLDFAKRRAIEPRRIDQTPYAPLLPATIMVSQVSQLTIAANLALNNKVARAMQ
ncbi:MAG: hypothetical protein MOB07_17320 [Acidobacteria bacterium]|nr:hypothetical protein [Acidobacteriota bacterium]